MANLLLESGGFSINVWEILIHIFNLIILVAVLKILVYKPVLKMIESRQRKISDILSENRLLEDEVEELAHEVEELEHEVEDLENGAGKIQRKKK